MLSSARRAESQSLDYIGASLKLDFTEATQYYRYRLATIQWEKFFEFLTSKNNRSYSVDTVRLAKKYGHLGFSYDLVVFADNRTRRNIMKAISNLCHFFDIQYDTILHEKWTQWIRHKKLSWKHNSRSNSFCLLKKVSTDAIIAQVRNKNSPYQDFIQFVLVSGLRSSEAVRAWNEHEKICDGTITEMFWDRKNKKANAVYCHHLLHQKIIDSKYKITDRGLRKYCNQKELGCELRMLRKINYTLVVEHISEPLAKFMQGRTGDVSQRLYYLPMMQNNHKKWQRIWDKLIFNK